MKQLMKNIFENKYIQLILGWVFHFYILFICKTSEIIVKGDINSIKNKLENSGLTIFAWHGRITLAPVFLKDILKGTNKNAFVLASAHRDGAIAANIMRTFNLNIIKGSSINAKKGSAKNKRSFSSIREILRTLENKNVCVLAADAPRGPAFHMNSKIVDLAKKTNTPIVVASISYKRKKIFNTWDKFEFPFPFNKIIVHYSDLFMTDKFSSIEVLNKVLEEELNKMTAVNDKSVLK